jgi:hypothetical protein
MRHSILAAVLTAAVLSLGPAPGAAATDKSKVENAEPAKLVEGKRERKQARMEAWVAGLEGDKKRIYAQYGHPSSRYREDVMGTVVEKWVYAGSGKIFTFKGNKLIRQS